MSISRKRRHVHFVISIVAVNLEFKVQHISCGSKGVLYDEGFCSIGLALVLKLFFLYIYIAVLFSSGLARCISDSLDTGLSDNPNICIALVFGAGH